MPGLVLDPGGTYGRVLALTELKCFVENKVSEQPKEYPGFQSVVSAMKKAEQGDKAESNMGEVGWSEQVTLHRDLNDQ